MCYTNLKKKGRKQMTDMKKEIIEWGICIVIAVVVGLFLKYFIGVPTLVKSVSMEPTLIEKQRLILNRASVRIARQMPKRGEIITFEAPINRNSSVAKVNDKTPTAQYDYPFSGIFSKFVYHVLEIGKDSYIKRVIALPGEHVQIKNGKVYINEKELEEPYLSSTVITKSNGLTDFIVPQNCVFAMGDNRENSADCRIFGCIPFEKIESVVWIRFWPFDLFGKVE